MQNKIADLLEESFKNTLDRRIDWSKEDMCDALHLNEKTKNKIHRIINCDTCGVCKLPLEACECYKDNGYDISTALSERNINECNEDLDPRSPFC